MQLWHDLTTLAILGTERSQEALSTDGPLGEVLARLYPPAGALATLPRDQALLNATAVLALYQRSGQLPSTVQRQQPVVCATETRPAVHAQGAFTLSVLLADKDKRALLPEYLTVLAQAGQRVPFALLPDLLEAGRQERRLRPSIVAVIGARGAWLAQQHEAWSYAAHTTDPSAAVEQLSQEWEVGDHSVRLAVFQRLRQMAPEQARTLLAGAWTSERAAQRAAFLQALQDGLSMADEPFLDTCLADRSAEVRQVAAALLSSLPEARLSQRMGARALPLVAYDSAAGTLTLTPPETFDPAWEQDTILASLPSRSGTPWVQQTWWLRQLLGLVPLSLWTQRWAVTPTTLLTSALASPWATVCLEAWTQAALWQRHADWAEVLLAVQQNPPQDLWTALSHAQREALWPTLLTQATTDERRSLLLYHLLTFPPPWSAAFSLQVADRLGTYMAHTPQLLPYNLHDLWTTCALCMAPEVNASLAEVWASPLRTDTRWEKGLARVLEMLRFRASYMTLR